jgi:hypothetical protein
MIKKILILILFSIVIIFYLKKTSKNKLSINENETKIKIDSVTEIKLVNLSNSFCCKCIDSIYSININYPKNTSSYIFLTLNDKKILPNEIFDIYDYNSWVKIKYATYNKMSEFVSDCTDIKEFGLVETSSINVVNGKIIYRLLKDNKYNFIVINLLNIDISNNNQNYNIIDTIVIGECGLP